MVRDIMSAPQARHRRNREHQPPARRKLRPERHQRALVVRYVLEHIEQHDQVVIAVFQRHVGQVPTLDRDAGALARKGARMIVRLDRVDRAELLQHCDVRSGAAADLQDAQRPLLGAPAFDQGGQNPAAPDEPPMVAVDLCHPVIDMAFHQASSSPASPIFSRTM